MVIEKILKQLTPGRIKEEREKIQNIKLPPEIQKWVKEYEKVGDRPEFLWKWLYTGDEIIIHSFGFTKKYYHQILETTFLLNVFITLLDDISESENNDSFIEEALKIPPRQCSANLSLLKIKERKYLLFMKKIWDEIDKKIKKYPYYKKNKEIFDYDIAQFLNNARYFSLLSKKPYAINELEYWMYSHHNMQVCITFDLYLMCCFSQKSIHELGKCREIVLCLQEMARIGNCLGTWKREVSQKDFTSSGVFIYIKKPIFTNINKLKGNLINNKNSFEKKLFDRWEENCNKVSKLAKGVSQINSKKLLLSLEKITFYHLAGRGEI